jgi:hypothetical protein
MPLIKRFGESKECPAVHKWYELVSGERITCDEIIINRIWWIWIEGQGVQRADTEEFTVFEFIDPLEIDLNQPAYDELHPPDY